MFKWWKETNEKLKLKLSNINLLKLYPNYFVSKLPFQIAFFFILLVILMGWAISGFNLAFVSISCPASSPLPCHNPVYVCPQNAVNLTMVGSHMFNDGMRCNDVPTWICDKVPCDKRYLQPGEKYGDNELIFNVIIRTILFFIFLPFLINHLLYLRKKGKI